LAIYINGRFLIKNLTGIQRYAMEVLKSLDDIKSDEKIILLHPKNIIHSVNLKNIEVIELPFLNDNLWEQITLPLYLINKRNVKLLNMFNSAPILRPGYIALHDIAFKTYSGHLTRNFVLWYSFLTFLNIKRYKHIFTQSEFSKNEICEVYKIDPNRVTPTYSAAEHLNNIIVDDNIIKKLNLEGKTFCFSLGSKSEHKNRRFVEECALKNPDIIFVISGGINTKVLKNSEYNDREVSNLLVTGFITDNELASLYKNCSCFIFPSLYEGFGIPPLEAITLGCKKVLVTDLPVLKEVYGENVNYIDFSSNDRYNIKDVLEKGKTSDITITKKYSWNKIAKIILDKME